MNQFNRNFVFLAALPTLAISQSVYAKDYLSVADARKILFPAAQTFLDHKLTITKDQKKAIKDLSGVRQRWDDQLVWRAEADGRFLGWLVVDEVVGKHEFITYAVGITPDGRVIGVEILSYRETHGYQIMEADWRNQFKGKTIDGAFKLDEDISNISGATLSCRNVTDGVKRVLALHQLVLMDG
ncbi:MAG: FMN-binding protein [Alphaproteobacteria bacterium]|nr:MAG: FMN-binding protein [Alphaproteobacteria bacterium]